MTEETTQAAQAAKERTRLEKTRRALRLALAALGLAAVIWFAVANSQHVSVNWFVVTTRSRLFFVIVLSALLGAVIDRLIVWRQRRARR